MGPSKCRPDFRRSKLEMADTEGPKWWNKYLGKIEAEICKPSIARPDVVFSVISKRQTFKVVSAILGLNEAKCDQLCIKEVERERLAKLERERLALEARLREEMRSFRSKSRGSTDPSGGTRITFDEDDDDDDDDDDDESENDGDIGCGTTESARMDEVVFVDTEPIGDVDIRTSIEMQGNSQQDFEKHYDAYSNPYLRFLRRPPERAASWRPRPEPTPTGAYQSDPNMTLIEKSAAVTRKIASDYCKWMRDLGGATTPEIDEKVLIELFQLEFDKPAARGIANRIREMPTITPAMAKDLDIPELDFKTYIRGQIRRDVVAESATPRLMAFGTQIDENCRVDPPINNTKAQWLGCNPPPELASFATAFGGIGHIESYIGYCKYLAQNPHLRRPPCMEEWGIFNPPALTSAVPSRTNLDIELGTATILMHDAAVISSTSLIPSTPSNIASSSVMGEEPS